MKIPSLGSILSWVTTSLRVAAFFVVLAAVFKATGILPSLPGTKLLTLVNTLVTTLVTLLVSLATGFAAQAASEGLKDTTLQRTRDRLKEKVQAYWLGQLQESKLRGADPILLEMENAPNMVEQGPWTVRELGDQTPPHLSLKQTMLNIFDKSQGALLILGTPGSGKTTALLELARGLIERVKEEKDPTPVVLNLSRWSVRRLEFHEWLVDELSLEYPFSKRTTMAWVRDQEVLLLLDGLDEVAEQYRSDCVDAINRFVEEYDAIEIVVCSRSADYENLDARLKLNCAILLQPLTRQQIDDYLSNVAEGSEEIRASLREDDDLLEFARSPLMLDMMSRLPIEADSTHGTHEDRRWRLFNTYIDYMLREHRKAERLQRVDPENRVSGLLRVQLLKQRQPSDENYTPQQTVHWLSWLARMMNEHSQSIMFLEQIQPSWLATTAQRNFYKNVFSLALAPLSILLVASYGLITINFIKDPQFTLGTLLTGLFFLFGLAYAVSWPFTIRDSVQNDIRVRDAITWSWSRAWRFGLITTIAMPIILGLMSLFMVLVLNEPDTTWWEEWFGSIGSFLLVIPLIPAMVVIMGGIVRDEVELRSVPNQGIRRQARNAVVVAMVTAVATGAAGAALTLVAGRFAPSVIASQVPLDSPYISIVLIVTLGFITSGLAFLTLGGVDCIKHAVLRYILYRNSCMPLNYPDFLAHASSLLFLRRVGGGYVFYHGLLQDHFAEMQEQGKVNLKSHDLR